MVDITKASVSFVTEVATIDVTKASVNVITEVATIDVPKVSFSVVVNIDELGPEPPDIRRRQALVIN